MLFWLESNNYNSLTIMPYTNSIFIDTEASVERLVSFFCLGICAAFFSNLRYW